MINCIHCGSAVPNHCGICPVCGNVPRSADPANSDIVTPEERQSQAELKERLERKYGTNAQRAAQRAKQQEETAKREADQVAKEAARRQTEQAQPTSAATPPYTPEQPYAYSPQYQPYYPQPTFTIHTGMLVWSIICIFFFAPLGIAGLILTVSAKNARSITDYENTMRTAQICNLIATILFAAGTYLLIGMACAEVILDDISLFY